MFLSAVSHGFSSVLDPRDSLGAKAGSACEEFEDNKDWINISESSGARSPRLSWIKNC